MKRSNRLVILVGVLLAVLAFVGIVILLNQRPTGVGETPEVRTVTVLVAAEEIDIGEEVTPDKVEPLEVDPAAVQGTRMVDPSQAGGRPSLFFVPEGAQVSQETVGLTIARSIAQQLEAGEKAIALQVERVTGLDFLVQPGDHVDIVLSELITVLQPTADSAADPDAPQRFEVVTGLEAAETVKTILQNKRVLYVSATTVQPITPPTEEEEEEQPEQAPPEITSVIIIFAGTDQDAEVIKFAQRDATVVGALGVVLRSTADHELPPEQEEVTTGVTIDVLVEEYGLRIPDIVESLGEAEEEAPQ